MYDSNEREWFNQLIFQHKDLEYNSNAILQLGITSSSPAEDLSNITPPVLEITIKQNSDNVYRKTRLSCVDVADLIVSIKRVFEALKQKEDLYVVNKQYTKSEALDLQFTKSSGNDPITAISVMRSESDFSRVVVHQRVIAPTLLEKLKDFVTNYSGYLALVHQIATNRLLTRNLNATRGIERAIQILPSSVVDMSNTSGTSAPVATTSSAQSDFDSGLDLENVEIEEIQKAEVPTEIVDVSSNLVDKVIKGDIEAFESLINTAITSDSPISVLQKQFGVSLPGILEKDLKSALYFSKLFFGCVVKNYTEKQESFPSSSPLIKYKPEGDIPDENISLAYDLLTFLGYVKALRGRMEDFEGDAIKNKSVMFIAMRCFTDIFMFSFLDHKEPSVIMSSVISRFLSFQEKGIFKKYDEVLEMNSCRPIEKHDIIYFVDELTKKVIGQNIPTINEFHVKAHETGQLRIPADNNLEIEQITKDVIRLEIAERFGKTFNTEDSIKEFLKKDDVLPTIVEIFRTEKKKGKAKQTTKKAGVKESNIRRFIGAYMGEVPDSHKDWIKKIIKQLESEPFDYKWIAGIDDFVEFGDTIIVGLYHWDPKNSISTGSYSEWEKIVKTSSMEKDAILTLWRFQQEEKPKQEEAEPSLDLGNWAENL